MRAELSQLKRSAPNPMPTSKNISRARQLRQTANTPEQKAWQTLRLLRKEGYPVRRQHPVAGLTVDFAIRALKLAIEIDGSIHELEHVKQNDAARDQRLAAEGWRILRIDTETAKSPDHLLTVVRDEIERLQKE